MNQSYNQSSVFEALWYFALDWNNSENNEKTKPKTKQMKYSCFINDINATPLLRHPLHCYHHCCHVALAVKLLRSGGRGGGASVLVPILGWENKQREALTVLADVSDVLLWHTLTEQRRDFLSNRRISVGCAWHCLTLQKWSCFIRGIKRDGIITIIIVVVYLNSCRVWRNWVWFIFLLMTVELLEVWMFYFTCLLKRQCDAVSLSLTFIWLLLIFATDHWTQAVSSFGKRQKWNGIM